MIHHVSIPARDPEHVARVLAELLGEVVTEDMLASYVKIANGAAAARAATGCSRTPVAAHYR